MSSQVSHDAFRTIFPKYAELLSESSLPGNESIETFLREELPRKVELVRNMQSSFNAFLTHFTTAILKRPQHSHLIHSLILKASDKIEKYFHHLSLITHKIDQNDLRERLSRIDLQYLKKEFRLKLESTQSLLKDKYFGGTIIQRECEEQIAMRLYVLLQLYHFLKGDPVTIAGKFRLREQDVLWTVSKNEQPNDIADLIHLDSTFLSILQETVQKRCRPFANKRDLLDSKVREVLREGQSRVGPNLNLLMQSLISKERVRISRELGNTLGRQLRDLPECEGESEAKQMIGEVQLLKREFAQLKNTTYFLDIMRGSFSEKYKMQVNRLENVFYLTNLQKFLQDVSTFLEKVLSLEERLIRNRRDYMRDFGNAIEIKISDLVDSYGSKSQALTLSEVIQSQFQLLQSALYGVVSKPVVKNQYTSYQKDDREGERKRQLEIKAQEERDRREAERSKADERRRKDEERLQQAREEREEKQRRKRQETEKLQIQRRAELQKKRQEKARKDEQIRRQKQQEQLKREELDKGKKEQQSRKRQEDEQKKRKEREQELRRREQDKKKILQREQEEKRKRQADLKERRKIEEQQRIKREKDRKIQQERIKREKEERESEQRKKQEDRLKSERQKRQRQSKQGEERRKEEQKLKKQKEQRQREQREADEKRKQEEKLKIEREKKDRQSRQAEQRDRRERERKERDNEQKQKEEEKLRTQKEKKERQRQKAEEERIGRENQQKLKKQQQDKLRQQKEKRDREEKQKKQREERQRKEKEEKDKKQRQKKEKQQKQKKERQQKERKEKLQKQRKDREEKQKNQRLERQRKEKQQKQRKDKEEKEKKQKLQKQKRQRQERERREREQRQKREREQKEKEKEKEKLEKEKEKIEKERKLKQQREAQEKRKKEQEQRLKKEQQLKNKASKKPQPKKSSGINYGQFDDLVDDDIEQISKGGNSKVSVPERDNDADEYIDDFDEQSPEKPGEIETKELVSANDIKCLNDYMKGTGYARKNKPNAELLNKGSLYILLFEEFVQNRKLFFFESAISKAVLDLGEELSNPDTSQQDLRMSVDTIKEEMLRLYDEMFAGEQMHLNTRFIFPFSFANEFHLKLIQIVPAHCYFQVVFDEQMPEDEELQSHFQGAIEALLHIFQLQGEPVIEDMVIGQESKLVLDTFDKELPCLLLLFARHYQQASAKQVLINQYTIERFFYTAHPIEHLYEAMKEGEQIDEFYEKLSEKYQKNDKIKICSVQVSSSDEQYSNKLTHSAMAIKQEFLKSRHQSYLACFTIQLQDESGEAEDRVTVYLSIDRASPKSTINYFLVSKDAEEQDNASLIFELISEGDENFEVFVYTDFSRHNCLGSYCDWTLPLWAHTTVKRKLSTLQAMRALAFAMTPYYLAFKEMD